MTKKPTAKAADYEEEAVPFDDVMRKLLKAKPQHREAGKAGNPKKKKAAKKE